MMSRMRRWLRLTWTAGFLIVAVLLCALWARSYWRVYSLYEQHYAVPSEASTYIHSWVEVQKGNVVLSKGFNDSPVRPSSGTFKWNIESRSQSYVRREGIPFRGFEYSFNNERVNLAVPCWVLILLLAAIAAVPWLRWRFGLRTLLIATTVIAVVMGAIVWVAKR